MLLLGGDTTHVAPGISSNYGCKLRISVALSVMMVHESKHQVLQGKVGAMAGNTSTAGIYCRQQTSKTRGPSPPPPLPHHHLPTTTPVPQLSQEPPQSPTTPLNHPSPPPPSKPRCDGVGDAPLPHLPPRILKSCYVMDDIPAAYNFRFIDYYPFFSLL